MTVSSKICYVIAPHGAKGGGMGRVKDYILQSGGDRHGRLRFESIDTRGSGRAIWSIPLLMLAILKIWLSALQGKVALIHVNMGDKGSIARKGLLILTVRLTGVPVILHFHAAELIRHYERANGIIRWCIRVPFHAVTCCVVIGKIWHDWLINELHIPAHKVEIVYNGVPVDKVMQTQRRFSGDSPCHFLFLGNLGERKGVSDLLHAFSQLKTIPSWKATIAGDGNLAQYQNLAASLSLAEKVHFTGWVDQAKARQLLREADALVLPSYDEGLPLVILEALGCGTPVIATAVGSIPEVLTNEETVLFVRPGNKDDIAATLKKMLENPLLRQQLSQNGQALFEREFTLDRFLDRLFAVYRNHGNVAIERKA